MQENDLFDIFPEFSKVVHILAVIPATSCSAERSMRCTSRMKTMGQQRTSNIALINIERACANSSLQSTIKWTVSLISSAVEMEETAISF